MATGRSVADPKPSSIELLQRGRVFGRHALKERVAALVQGRSERKDGPFVKINCASIPEPLMDRVLEADVRIVAATNRDLQKAIAEGRFREDLYRAR